MLAVLAAALLVQRVARRYASASAALFAAGAFMVCPVILRKLRIAEPDTLITFLSFAAFVVWWNGEERGRVTGWRWLACGGLLTVLAMAKGPQPVGFFALGVGGYLLWRRAWSSLAGLVLCLMLPAAATLVWAVAAMSHTSSVGFSAQRRPKISGSRKSPRASMSRAIAALLPSSQTNERTDRWGSEMMAQTRTIQAQAGTLRTEGVATANESAMSSHARVGRHDRIGLPAVLSSPIRGQGPPSPRRRW